MRGKVAGPLSSRDHWAPIMTRQSCVAHMHVDSQSPCMPTVQVLVTGLYAIHCPACGMRHLSPGALRWPTVMPECHSLNWADSLLWQSAIGTRHAITPWSHRCGTTCSVGRLALGCRCSRALRSTPHRVGMNSSRVGMNSSRALKCLDHGAWGHTIGLTGGDPQETASPTTLDGHRPPTAACSPRSPGTLAARAQQECRELGRWCGAWWEGGRCSVMQFSSNRKWQGAGR